MLSLSKLSGMFYEYVLYVYHINVIIYLVYKERTMII